MKEVPWLALARDFIGVKEIHGDKHEPKILAMWKDAKLPFSTDEDAWCAAYAGAMLERVHVNSSRKANARSYQYWGNDVMGNGIAYIPVGAVVVFDRPPNDWQGHVGFAVGRTETDDILTLGGNQSDSVNIKPIKGRRLIAARWPTEFAGDLRLLHYLPLMKTNAALSVNEA
jgi:uncharacterized protein (TIGR02594 family)